MANLKLTELLNQVVIQLGMKNDPVLSKINANEQLKRVEIPEEIASKIDINLLMTEEAAKKHPEVHRAYRAQNYGTMDNAFKREYENFGFSEDQIKKIEEEKDTTKRVALIGKEIKNIRSELSKPKTGDEDVQKKMDGYVGEITSLRKQLNDQKTSFDQQMNDVNNGFETERVHNLIDRKLSGFKYSDGFQREKLMRMAKEDLLEGEGYQIIREGKALKLTAKDDPNLGYFVDNKEVSFDDLVNRAVQPYLAKTPPQNPGGGAQNQDPNADQFVATKPDHSARNKHSYNSNYADANAEQLSKPKPGS